MKTGKTKKVIKKIILILFIIGIITLIGSLIINEIVKNSTKNQILTIEELADKEIDCILILGAGIWDNKPSPMLEDRLITGFNAYEELAIPVIISGDHGQVKYDEVNVMKSYLIDKGIASNVLFMDHAGFSTYESVYRAKEIFEAKKVLIVTQNYHLYRALYIANKLGIDAYGLNADIRTFKNQPIYNLREYLARNKDFVKVMFKPKPTYLGDVIPVSGDGNNTND